MTDVEFDNPAFERDDPLEDFDDEEVDPLFVNPSDVTAMGDQGGAGAGERSPQQDLLQTAVDDYYNALAKKGLTPSPGRDRTKFELDGDGRLRLKKFPEIRIVNLRTGAPLSFKTIADTAGGGAAVQEMGFKGWRSKEGQSLSAEAVKALQNGEKKIGDIAASKALTSDSMELQDLGAAAQDATEAARVVETTLTDTDIDEILGTLDDPPLNLRELRGLDKALKTIRGELVNNLAKLSELDEHIAKEKRKLGETEDEFSRRRLAERLRNLEDERASRLEAAAANREALRSQISRIRETFRRILDEDTTLAERIRTLFREQGITIASILTAIGMAISTLVLALTGSGGSAPTPPQPPSKGGVAEWVKKTLKSLGRALAKLAGKAAAALPGIIGSVVSWLLSLLAKTAGWLAENLWAVAVAVGGLLLVAAREWLTPPALPKKPKRE